jgi:DNA-binding transcriptional MerR regulator
MSETLTASEVCAVAGCSASTLRAWRNRNGLFPHHHSSGGWTRFDLADVIGVRLVTLLADRGFAAQPVINLVNAMRPTLENAARTKLPRRIGVGRGRHGDLSFPLDRFSPLDNDVLEFRELDELGTVMDNLGWFEDSVVIAINLASICWEIEFKIRELRGEDQRVDQEFLDDLASALSGRKSRKKES